MCILRRIKKKEREREGRRKRKEICKKGVGVRREDKDDGD